MLNCVDLILVIVSQMIPPSVVVISVKCDDVDPILL